MDHRLYILKCMHNSLLYARMHSGIDVQRNSESRNAQPSNTTHQSAARDRDDSRGVKIDVASDYSGVESKLATLSSSESKR